MAFLKSCVIKIIYKLFSYKKYVGLLLYNERDELTGAYRETYEETRIVESDLKVYMNTQKILDYEDNEGVLRKIYYWLAELRNPTAEVKLSHEHQKYKWLPVTEACEIAEREELKTLLQYYNKLIYQQKLK